MPTPGLATHDGQQGDAPACTGRAFLDAGAQAGVLSIVEELALSLIFSGNRSTRFQLAGLGRGHLRNSLDADAGTPRGAPGLDRKSTRQRRSKLPRVGPRGFRGATWGHCAWIREESGEVSKRFRKAVRGLCAVVSAFHGVLVDELLSVSKVQEGVEQLHSSAKLRPCSAHELLVHINQGR